MVTNTETILYKLATGRKLDAHENEYYVDAK